MVSLIFEATLAVALREQPQLSLDSLCWHKCWGHGLCDPATGHCTCDPGYSGSDCREGRCPNGCSHHGNCVHPTVPLRGVSAPYSLTLLDSIENDGRALHSANGRRLRVQQGLDRHRLQPRSVHWRLPWARDMPERHVRLRAGLRRCGVHARSVPPRLPQRRRVHAGRWLPLPVRAVCGRAMRAGSERCGEAGAAAPAARVAPTFTAPAV